MNLHYMQVRPTLKLDIVSLTTIMTTITIIIIIGTIIKIITIIIIIFVINKLNFIQKSFIGVLYWSKQNESYKERNALKSSNK